MINRELNTQFVRLLALFERATDFSGLDSELQSHWAKYLCVLTAGFIENALKEILMSYVRGKASPQVINFASSMLKQIQNPKAKRFKEKIGLFSQDWLNELVVFLETDGRGEAIDSIMANRHLIAHGKASNISLAQLKGYFNKSVEVVDKLEQICSVS